MRISEFWESAFCSYFKAVRENTGHNGKLYFYTCGHKYGVDYMATIKDVAKLAGVSVCTVSRTISDKGYIKDETRKKVWEAIRQLDYKPNKVAVSLKTGRSNVLALIIPDVMNMYYARLAKYLEEEAGKLGYMVYLCNSDNDAEREKQFVEILCQRNVDGVVVTPCTDERQYVHKLADAKIPYVYLNRTFPDDMEHCIRMDNFKATYECITYLIAQGHKKIGAVFQNFSNMIYQERYLGMMKALQDHGIPYQEDYMIFNGNCSEECRRRMERMLANSHRPGAIFAANDMLAIDVYKSAHNCGLSIPDDLSVVGFDDIIMAEKIAPAMTTYCTPAKEMAKAAMMYIDHSIHNKDQQSFPVYEGKLIIRDSVKEVLYE